MIIIVRICVHKNRILGDVIIDVRGGAVIILADHRADSRRQAGAGIGRGCIPGVIVVNIEIDCAVVIDDGCGKSHHIIVLD